VSTRRVASGGVVHDFMTFALPRGRTFTERDRVALALLQPAIQAALARLCVPLIASQSILAQIVDEQSIGFMCVSRAERIAEVNQQMHALVTRYLRAARVEGGRGALARFATRAMGETTGSRTWQIRHDDGHSLAEVSGHRLSRETHAIGEDLFLIMMREILLAPPAAAFRASGAMTERQREIARLLVETGDSYKQIAGTLGIKGGTMRKHVEHVYRALGVQSRAELSKKLR
jgi:DNA-binding CsgD family transcriptional regulator